ncbi:MAG: Flagellar hook-length control protein FliK [Myxococcales bacterium]|nr:Flagellar hook-length control protein FliK [Myxococcales bacterium]
MRTTLLVSMVVGVVGCGHGIPGPTDDMAGDMSVSDDMSVSGDMTIPDDAQHLVTYTMFAMDYAKEICAHYMKCGQLDVGQTDACIERNLKHLGWDEDVEIMKGRVSVNELQCLDALKNARCDNSDSAAWQSRCVTFLHQPHQPNGATCLAGVECTSGLCKHGGSDGGAAGVMQVTGCAGTCAPTLALGDQCRLSSDCGSTAYCDPGTGVCTHTPALNEVCAGFCQFGLLCPSFPAALPAHCIVPTMQTMLDGDCDPIQGVTTPTPPCPAAMYCQVQYSGATAVGGKCKMKVAADTACDPKNDGAYAFAESQCADGTTCHSLTGVAGSETCHAFGALDGDCVSFGGTTSSCKQGLWCDTTTTPGKCKAFVVNGGSCPNSSARCGSSLPGQATCIDDTSAGGTTYTCQPAKNFGAACKPGIEDSLCAASDNAGSTYCAPTGGGTGTCAPKCF